MLPILLTQTQTKLALVVGGGVVGTRKVLALLAGEMRVRVIAPAVSETLAEKARQGEIEWLGRTFRQGDLAGVFLAVAAADQRSVNAAVAEEARARGILVNVADAPAEGNIHFPAVHRAEEAIIAVSSRSGRPGIAQRTRDRVIALNGG